MNASIPAFLDELEKISVEISDKAQLRQAVQFGTLGALAGPVVSGLGNIIEHGHYMPKGAVPGRWAARQMATGALVSGLLPIVRHHIERGNIERARARIKQPVRVVPNA